MQCCAYSILRIAPAIIRRYGFFILLPASAIRFAMPITELLVAVFVAVMMIRYAKELAPKTV